MSHRRTPGLFIAIEGIDGAGTTSQAARLEKTLRQRGHPLHVTAEPSRGPVGQLIRAQLGQVDSPPSPALMALLFAADRVHHLRQEIEPHLEAGQHVLSDRYVLSSLAYQSLELPLEWVLTLNREARPPDLTLLLRVDPDVAAARRNRRGTVSEIYDADPVQHRIARHYDELARALPEQRVQVIDANRDFEAVAAEIEATVWPLVEPDEG